ncbi:unnamed protein product, partial [Allacma fusca]
KTLKVMKYFKTSLLLIFLSYTLGFENRIRRQKDSATEVVGLAADNSATKRDYGVLKTASKNTAQRSRGKRDLQIVQTEEHKQTSRRKRQLPSFLSNARTNNVLTPVLGNLLPQNTRDQAVDFFSVFLRTSVTLVTAFQQQVFNLINFDFDMATALKNSLEVQSDPLLDRMLILNKNGVTCEDVCQNGNSIGNIGICTNQYCTCYFKSEDLRLRFCPANTVFDSLTRKCARPEETILCSDEDDVPT